jgi:catechol 2,3-dioxygenase-like lactoylglutathione lyase family enzyme
MPSVQGLKVLFVAGFGPIVRSPAESRSFYLDTLGLPLEPMQGDQDYLHGHLDGVKHFALWPLAQAAESCFGKREWPADVPAPTSWIEFDVEDVAAAASVLKQKGYQLLIDHRKEPWGQIVTRLLSPEGVLIGLTFTPWMRS